MRHHVSSLVLALTCGLAAHADSYTLINFNDRPPTYISPGFDPDLPPEGANSVLLSYPGVDFYGGVLVADGASFGNIRGGYDPSRASPPYSNSYQATLFGEYGDGSVSPGYSVYIGLTTPVKEIDFDFFSENHTHPFTSIIAYNSAHMEIYDCYSYAMLSENISNGHFDCQADDIDEVIVYGGEPGPYVGIDNVELNAYLKNSPSPVPEPPASLLAGTGALILGTLGRKRRRSN